MSGASFATKRYAVRDADATLQALDLPTYSEVVGALRRLYAGSITAPYGADIAGPLGEARETLMKLESLL